MERLRTAGTTTALLALLALSGCADGGGPGGGNPDGRGPVPSASPSTGRPYDDAYYRLQVVAFLDSLAAPENGGYRAWLRDDPAYLDSFVYTPRDARDPDGDERGEDGAVSVVPNRFTPDERTAFFAALTRDGTVVPDSLAVTRPWNPGPSDSDYTFTFTVRTTDGRELTGTAGGAHSGTPEEGAITRLTYDLP
ncbi:hypothetical protein [Streptomyces chumphonensis]|uniref:hypothetical protein n=1 Tax=Streptomyces chumphonensis TaxID=1214925 RepID=UPI003D73B9DC